MVISPSKPRSNLQVEKCTGIEKSSVESIAYHKTKPIGFLQSCHRYKNATPRQGSVTSLSKGRLTILKDVFNNPSYSLEGLQQYSHVWILFIFHQSLCRDDPKPKVSPPRLNGEKVGVYASRSPHRPNSIGLTLATLDEIEGDTVMVSGIDILDGTPVLDIKPYIPQYDSPTTSKSENNPNAENRLSTLLTDSDTTENQELGSRSDGIIDCDSTSKEVKTAQWLSEPPIPQISVIFNPIAEKELKKFSKDAIDAKYRLEYLTNDELRETIITVLSQDPRSSYRRKKCSDRLYYFEVDSVHITTFFDESTAEVLRIAPITSKGP